MNWLLLLFLATASLPHMERTGAYDRARLVVYAAVIGPAFGHRAEELLALAWKESRMRQRPPRSSAGACGAFQALGGRYGHPPCRALEGDLFLATWWGARDLRYWKDHCGGRALAAYNGGWAGCRGKCSGGFAADVRRAERKLERAMRRITGPVAQKERAWKR